METTIQPAGSGAGSGLDFTEAGQQVINTKAHGGGTPGASDFEQDRGLSMSNDSTPAKSGVGQVNSVRLYLETITADGLPREIRMIHATKTGKEKVQSRLLNLEETSIQEVIDFLAESEEMGFNAYITVNPLKSETIISDEKSTNDTDILHRAFIPVDIDPIRTSKTLATEAQREAAKMAADAVLKWYRSNYPDHLQPVVGCSGSGWQILLPCTLSATKAADDLVKRLLKTLADTFSTDAAKVDQTVKNRSRIMRICGTMAIYSDGQRHGWFESGPTPDELMQGKRLTEADLLAYLGEEKPTTKPTAAATEKANGKAHGIPILTLGGATIEKRVWAYIRPILADIATAPDQAKHETLFKKTAKIANYAAGADLEGYGADFTKAIEDALASNPSKVADWKAARKTIADAWKKGTGEPEKLKDRPLTASVESNGRADHDQSEPGTAATGGSRDNRPVVLIPLERNNPAELLDKLTPHLAKAGIYQRDGGLCRIVQASESKVKGIGRKAAGGPVVDPHDVHSITPAIGKTVSFYAERVSKTGEIFTVATEPPGKLMQQLLRLKNWPETPLLVGITRAPFMRPDGTICTEPGYDAETGWYLDYSGPSVHIPVKPTRAMAEDAARTLLSLVDDFEFMSESHRAAFLTYLLTLIARPGIEGHCPAHVFTANTPGSGKTLLADVGNLIAFGQAPPGYQAPQNAENADEWRKMLFSFAQAGALSLVISNYPSGQAVGNAPLDMALTEHRIVDRVLGKSETRESAWVAAVAITGNNLGSSADFVFRSIWCVLESSEENPRQRTGFKIPDLRKHVMEHRHNLLRKALTILAWHAGEGFPSASGQHYGSFEEWAKVVRDAVMHLTGHDVLKNNEAAGVADVEADELTQLLTGFKVYAAWKAESLGFKADSNGTPLKDESGNFIPHGIEDIKVTAADIYNDLDNWDNRTSFSDLRSLADVGKGKRSFESSFGKLINRHKGRVKNLGEKKPQRFKIIVKTYDRRKYIQIIKFQEKETNEQTT